jgi:phosphate transport system protein
MHLIGFELDRLEKQLLTLTAVVEESVQLAIKALGECNYELAQKVVDNDAQVNRMEVELEEECLKVLALHQPVANDLRMIVVILKINNDLERIADQAANISERAIAICELGNGKNRLNIDQMAEKVLAMLEKSLDSLVNTDLETARAVLDLDDEVDTIHSENYQAFKSHVRQDPQSVDQLLNYLTVSRHLERIADLATNIAEDVIYLNEGEIIRHTIA